MCPVARRTDGQSDTGPRGCKKHKKSQSQRLVCCAPAPGAAASGSVRILLVTRASNGPRRPRRAWSRRLGFVLSTRMRRSTSTSRVFVYMLGTLGRTHWLYTPDIFHLFLHSPRTHRNVPSTYICLPCQRRCCSGNTPPLLKRSIRKGKGGRGTHARTHSS